jgi:transcriptional regulator GlxA family with amidase domain
MNIVCFIYPGLTALDIVGPYELMANIPGAQVRFVAPERGLVRTDDGQLGLQADASIDEVQACDVLLVSGGFGSRALLGDERVLEWLRRIDRTTRITASICTGALLLAAAGLLQGRRANTHWAVRERLAEYGAIPVADRWVSDGKYRTAAGVSAGIDLALALIIELCGREVAQAVQLGVEYDPAPPLDAGNAERAPAALRDRLQQRVRERA